MAKKCATCVLVPKLVPNLVLAAMLPNSAITASGLDCKSACRSGVCNDRIPALLVSRAILPLMLTSCQAKI